MRMILPPKNVDTEVKDNDLNLVRVTEHEGYISLMACCGVQTLKDLQTLLRTGEKRELYITYAQASAIASKLGLKSKAEYGNAYCKGLLSGCPKYPETTYKSVWKTWPEFLTHKSAYLLGRKNFPVAMFENVLAWQRKKKLANNQRWKEAKRAGKMPFDFPQNLHVAYGKSKLDLYDFFPKRSQARVTADKKPELLKTVCVWQKARQFANEPEWVAQYKQNLLPKGFPRSPKQFFGDALPKDFWPKTKQRVTQETAISYKECLTLQQTELKVKNARDWQKLANKNFFKILVPTSPHTFYKDFDANEFWYKEDANTKPEPKSMVAKPSEGRFEIKRYSSSPDAVRQQAA